MCGTERESESWCQRLILIFLSKTITNLIPAEFNINSNRENLQLQFVQLRRGH